MEVYQGYNECMLEHHIQRSIVKKLATKDSLRFSELQPEGVENKAFDYHLKQLIVDKLIVKNPDGGYELTALGRKLGITTSVSMKERTERAFSVLFLVIKSDLGWLLYKRKTHPLKDRVGFMHARPNSKETIFETCKKVTLEKTGLDCDFKYRANGYFRMFDGDEVESFTHFTLLVCNKPSGKLQVNDENADYEWYKNPYFSAPEMLPNMKDITDILDDPNQTFLEKSYQL